MKNVHFERLLVGYLQYSNHLVYPKQFLATNWGYGLSIQDELEKFQYDLFYIGHQCFYLDLLIIVRTLRVLSRRRRFQSVAPSTASVD